MKICSDLDPSDCCTAKLDKGVRKDEWVKSKTENWESREFKTCKNKQFKVLLREVFHKYIDFEFKVL